MSAPALPFLARFFSRSRRKGGPGPLKRLLLLLSLRRQRRDLRALDDRLLEDVGLSRSQAERESGRAFWDAPLHWRQ